LAAVTRPRLRSVGESGEVRVPATARYADQLTDGALALRLQAITRLGLPAPRHLASLTDARAVGSAATAASASAASAATAAARGDAGETADVEITGGKSAGAEITGGEIGAASPADVGEGRPRPRKFDVVPDAADGAPTEAVPGRPDGAQASLDAAGATPGQAIGRNTPLQPASSAATPDSTDASAAAGTGAQPVKPAELVGLPGVRVWGGRLAQAVSEVLVGDRPISQLVRFTDDAVFMDLNRRVRMLGLNSTAGSRGAKEKSTVRSVRVFMPAPSIAEVAAHVRHGERSRAIALRLEVRRNRWVCTALELG
jgi:hypothetical protein